MDDLISRQAAIDAADRADYTGIAVEDVKKVTDEVVKELKKLPSAESRWIPVTERLPEDDTEVWVTTDMLFEVTRARWHKDSNLWCHPYNADCLLVLRPIAWMEMSFPEPYKGGCEEHLSCPDRSPGSLFCDYMNATRNLPSAQPETHDKRTETHECDYISRQDALKEIARWSGYLDDDMISRIQTGLEKMPSAQRKGKWIRNNDSDHAWKCSVCGCGYTDYRLNYCYDCGAWMKGEEDETD